jgi:hypothetical protein
MLRISFRLFLSQFKTMLWVCQQRRVFIPSPLNSYDKIWEKAFSVTKDNLDAPRLMRNVAMPPTHDHLGITIQHFGERLFPSVKAWRHDSVDVEAGCGTFRLSKQQGGEDDRSPPRKLSHRGSRFHPFMQTACTRSRSFPE